MQFLRHRAGGADHMGVESALADAPLGDYILPLGILVEARNVRRFRTQRKATVSAIASQSRGLERTSSRVVQRLHMLP